MSNNARILLAAAKIFKYCVSNSCGFYYFSILLLATKPIAFFLLKLNPYFSFATKNILRFKCFLLKRLKINPLILHQRLDFNFRIKCVIIETYQLNFFYFKSNPIYFFLAKAIEYFIVASIK